jgi:hypothetical protein
MFPFRQAMCRSLGAVGRRQRSATVVEALEGRRLLSAAVVVTPAPLIVAAPNGPTVGSVSRAKTSKVAIQATTGVPFYGKVARITGLTSGSTYRLSAVIDWGDGSADSAGHLFKNSDGSYYVSGWHEYESAGTFSVTVTIEATPASATASASASSAPIILIVGTVTDTATVKQGATPVTSTGLTLPLKAGKAFTGSVGTFDYISAIGSPYKLLASIDWGDGESSSGSIRVDSSLGAGGYAVDGSHTYALGGTYRITATVTLEETPTSAASAAPASSSATVAPVLPVVLISTIHATADVAVKPNSGPGSITIQDGVLTILGTSGNDTITVRQTPATYPIEPLTSSTGSTGVVPVIGLPPSLIVTIDGTTTTLSTAGITSLYVNGEAGNDTIDLGGLIHLGGAFPPPYFVNEAVKLNSVIHGGGGDDTLIGGDGTDSLYGDNGNDTLHATLGGDSAYGGTGDDIAINIGSYRFAYIAPNVKHVINEPPPPLAPVPQSSAT